MKITRVRATCLAIPYRRPERWADGIRPGVNNVLVEIETDAGIIGLGEATCGSGNSANPTREVIEAFAPYLLDEDPRRIRYHIDRFLCQARWRLWRVFTNTALAAIEMALWDILGKACGQPVSALLGGALRDRIPVFGFVFHDTPAAMGDQARRMIEQGFDVLYLAVGLSPAEDEASVCAVREAAGPKTRLRVDANESWDRATAMRSIERLAPYDLEFIEQPVPGYDVEGMADLRRRSPVPVAANQSCWTLEDVMRVLRANGADAVVTSLHWLGGIINLLKCEAICRTANVRFARHSSGELGVAAAAGCHALAVMPRIDDGNQSLFSHWQHDIVKGDAMAIVDGCQRVPSGPGLGVALDPGSVADFADRYRRDGPFVTSNVT